MQGVEKNNSIGHFAVLAGLWFINLLIVVFGSPFLIFKKIRNIFLRTSKTPPSKTKTKSEAAQYFPCRIDSKL